MSNTEADLVAPASLSFPLPFRVVFLGGLGLLAWATNLHGLYSFNIDVATALNLRTEDHPPKSPHPLPSHRWTSHRRHPYANIYSSSIVYFSWFFTTWSLYLTATHGNPLVADAFKYVAAITLTTLIGVIICPFDILFKAERDQFLRTLKRCVFPAASGPIYFSDVVFSDVLTSFAKVLGDLWLSICMLFPGNTIVSPPRDSGWKRWILPTVMSVPYLVRLRQCLIEYSSSPNQSSRPLFNAFKYATAFPVIYLSAAQRIVLIELAAEKGDDVFTNPWHGEHLLFRLWFLTAVINSLYSFWWDVTFDWGLAFLKPKDRRSHKASTPHSLALSHLESASPLLSRRSSQDTTSSDNNAGGARESSTGRFQGLRPTLLYPAYIYPILVAINFVLRMTWSIKLSSHLHLKAEGSSTIFYVEVAEIVRRWLWVFIRVEWEVIKKAQEATSRLEDSEYEFDIPPSHHLAPGTRQHE